MPKEKLDESLKAGEKFDVCVAVGDRYDPRHKTFYEPCDPDSYTDATDGGLCWLSWQECDTASQLLGSRWKKVGSTKPMKGVEIVNEKLVEALTKKREFSKDEISQFQLKDLPRDSYIKVPELTFSLCLSLRHDYPQ